MSNDWVASYCIPINAVSHSHCSSTSKIKTLCFYFSLFSSLSSASASVTHFHNGTSSHRVSLSSLSITGKSLSPYLFLHIHFFNFQFNSAFSTYSYFTFIQSMQFVLIFFFHSVFEKNLTVCYENGCVREILNSIVESEVARDGNLWNDFSFGNIYWIIIAWWILLMIYTVCV